MQVVLVLLVVHSLLIAVNVGHDAGERASDYGGAGQAAAAVLALQDSGSL